MYTPALRRDAAPDDALVLQPATLAEPLSVVPEHLDEQRTEERGDSTARPTRPIVRTVSEFLEHVLASGLVAGQDLEQFLEEQGGFDDDDVPRLTAALMEHGLLTNYQVHRLRTGRTFGLVLGNYRIVDRLGAGGMGVVYKAEHLYLKRTVAIKVLILEDGADALIGQRFGSEMQAMAALQHPNIVTAYDAGAVPLPGSDYGTLRYLAMEYVPGQALDGLVRDHGPLPAPRACRLICQAAQALQHAHERGMVHRDIKPSNLILTPQEQIKVLDFGLAQLGRRRCTVAYALLGTIDWVAPEQARDARCADIRADVYGLGGTLYWLLTGRKPFPGNRPPLEELLARQREKPVPLRHLRPDLPVPLEAVVERMLAHDPNDRYATPLAVVSALTPFCESGATVPAALRDPVNPGVSEAGTHTPEQGRRAPRILLVSPRPDLRATYRIALTGTGMESTELDSVEEVLMDLGRTAADVVLIDLDLPNHDGLKLCHRLRALPSLPYLKVLLLTTADPSGQLTAGLRVGADDGIAANASAPELIARLRSLLRLKELEERASHLADQVGQMSRHLEETLQRRDADLEQAQEVLIFGMARMAELRGLESSAHLARMQSYVRILTEEALHLPVFAGRIDAMFVRMIERCVLLHDIGKVALPDHVLLKPGKLDAEERAIMESHAALGADILAVVARQHGAPLAFLQMATEIARHHHERFDGAGYPDGLAGEAIPLAARLVTVADVYDALRSKLVYKPGLTHAAACRLILEGSPGQFDPAVLLAFRRCEASFARIFDQ